MRPAHLKIDLNAIRGNISAIARTVGPSTAIAAIVKANAYGHGAVEVSRACIEAGAKLLCVVIPQEGVELREAGITAPILVLGPPDAEEIPLYFEHDLACAVSDTGHAALLADGARQRRTHAAVHVKLDTGMGRYGARPAVATELAGLLAGEDALRVEGIFSHFADAYNPDLEWSRHQLDQFRTMLRRFGADGADRPMLHLSGSGGIVRMNEAHFDAVRPGSILYGLNSGFDPELMPEGIKPALSLVCRIGTVKTVETGQPVGYRCTWRAPRESCIAVLPMGYSDGYPRSLSNNSVALVGGRRCPVVGVVSMDAITVDVTDVGPVQAGDEAVLIGRQAEESITVEELAERAGSIVEEISARLSIRLPRLYDGRRED